MPLISGMLMSMNARSMPPCSSRSMHWRPSYADTSSSGRGQSASAPAKKPCTVLASSAIRIRVLACMNRAPRHGARLPVPRRHQSDSYGGRFNKELNIAARVERLHSNRYRNRRPAALRQGARALPQRPLHEHAVEPAAELESAIRETADHGEPERPVQFDRRRIGGIADYRDHLPEAARFAVGDHPLEQRAAEAATLRFRSDVYRVLDREAVGGPRTIGTGIGIAGHGAVHLGDNIREAAVEQRALALRHLGLIRRLELERGGAEPHGVLVDAGDRGNVGRRRGAERDAGHD